MFSGRPSNYPENIYFGACSDLGGVAYKLTNITDGVAVTELNVPLSTFQPSPGNSRPMAVRVSWSVSEPDKSLACGDVPSASDTAGENPPPADPNRVFIQLNAMNGSYKSGWADIAPDGAKTLVRVSVQNSGPGTNYPAAIFAGACDDVGPVAYKLNNVANGMSSTELDVNFTNFKSGQKSRPMAVNVDAGTDQPGKALSCGSFTGSQP